MEKIALYGGEKAKTTPYGTGKRFGKEELTLLEEALAFIYSYFATILLKKKRMDI